MTDYSQLQTTGTLKTVEDRSHYKMQSATLRSLELPSLQWSLRPVVTPESLPGLEFAKEVSWLASSSSAKATIVISAKPNDWLLLG
ncbi:hypothetical protein STEG23_003351, partial [Scotinomys teguina]